MAPDSSRGVKLSTKKIMKYTGEWIELFPLLKGFDEKQYAELRIEQQTCEEDSRLYKYTLYYNQLPIDTKLWRDEDKRNAEFICDTSTKVPKLMVDDVSDTATDGGSDSS